MENNIKFAGFGISAPEGGMGFGYADGGYTWWTDFLFQGMFAATAATIVSGAVAERIKLSGFMLFAILYVGIVYPIVGAWKWGWWILRRMGILRFAGSTLVHSVGGWGALNLLSILGARIVNLIKTENQKLYPVIIYQLHLPVFSSFGWGGLDLMEVRYCPLIRN